MRREKHHEAEPELCGLPRVSADELRQEAPVFALVGGLNPCRHMDAASTRRL